MSETEAIIISKSPGEYSRLEELEFYDKLCRTFKKTTGDKEWYLALEGPYEVLAGLTNLIESHTLRWAIVRSDIECSSGWELYIKYASAKKIIGTNKTYKESFSDEVRHLCAYVAQRVSENMWLVEDPYTRTNLHRADKILKAAANMNATYDDVVVIVDWAVEDDFWRTNIRSMNAFYKHFDKLRDRSKGSRPNAPRNGKTTRGEILQAALEKWGEGN